MNHPQHIQSAIDQAYKLEGILRILSLALEGEQITGASFAKVGGGGVIDMAAALAGEIVEGLDRGE